MAVVVSAWRRPLVLCLLAIATRPSAAGSGQTAAGEPLASLGAVLGSQADDASLPQSNEQFGWSVALDEDWAVVGAPRDPGMTANEINDAFIDGFAFDDQEGAAFVYSRGGNGWARRARLIPSDHESRSAENCRMLQAPWNALKTVLPEIAATVGQYFACRMLAESRLHALGYGRRQEAGAPTEEQVADQQATLRYFTTAGNASTEVLWVHDGKIAVMVGPMDQLSSGNFTYPVEGTNGTRRVDPAVVDYAAGNACAALSMLWTVMRVAYAEEELEPCGSRFGSAVSISGSQVAVGAPYYSEQDSSEKYTGAAYVFSRQDDGEFVQTAKLTAGYSWLVERGHFGSSLAISGDTLAIGARGDASASGSVHVFKRSGACTQGSVNCQDAWALETVLTSSETTSYVYKTIESRGNNDAEGNHFGSSLDLGRDGRLVVGAPGAKPEQHVREAIAALGARASAVLPVVALWTSIWDDPSLRSVGIATGLILGIPLAASGLSAPTGADIGSAIGAPIQAIVDMLHKSPCTAAAYVFGRRDGVGSWTEEAKLVPESNECWGFGHSVSMDQDTVLVGAINDKTFSSGMISGAAYVYQRSSQADPAQADQRLISWTRAARLESPIDQKGAMFGSSVAVKGDYALVGAAGINQPYEPTSGLYGFLGLRSTLAGAGASWLYRRYSDGGWKLTSEPRLDPVCPRTATDAQFGASAALDSDCPGCLTALVGLPRDESGSVYVYETATATHKTGFKLSFWGFGGGKADDAETSTSPLESEFEEGNQAETMLPTVVGQLATGHLNLHSPVGGRYGQQPFQERDMKVENQARREATTMTFSVLSFSRGSAQQVSDTLTPWLQSEFLAELNKVPGFEGAIAALCYALPLTGGSGVTSVQVHQVDVGSVTSNDESSSSDNSDSGLVVLVACAVAGTAILLAVLAIAGLVYLWKRARQPAQSIEPANEPATPHEISMGNVGVVINPVHAQPVEE